MTPVQWIAVFCLLFLAGCVETVYHHAIYNPDGTLVEVYDITHRKCNVNDEKKGIVIAVADGSIMTVGQIITVADPNSMTKPLEAGGKIMRYFLLP